MSAEILMPVAQRVADDAQELLGEIARSAPMPAETWLFVPRKLART